MSEDEKIDEGLETLAAETGDEIDASRARWYVVHVYTGQEEVVRRGITELMDDLDIGKYIFDTSIQNEKISIVKGGGKGYKQKNSYPGYLFVKMVINKESWYRIRNKEGVIGFAGQGTRPTPLTDEEVRRLGIEDVDIDIDVNSGDQIMIIRGPFENMTGVVEEADPVKKTLKAKITMFGRDKQLNLVYDDIDKI
jgi:transcriptional antiterminator NusG